MKNIIMSKLRSQTGASITFALLIFLVCTVLCSVILTAATASSGRMSGIAEGDQRYYAVTSAAELLKDLINGKSVTIERIYSGTKTETHDESHGVPSDTTSTNYGADYILKIDSTTIGDTNPKFNSFVEDAADKYDSGGGTGSYTLKSSSELNGALRIAADSNLLSVQISEIVDAAGNITMTVGNDYKLQLLFSASVVGPNSSETAGESNITIESDTKYTINTKMTKTDTTIIKWTLSEIKANS